MTGTLTLVCRKCTRQGRFAGNTPGAAAELGKLAGWLMPRPEEFICPRCAKILQPKPNAVKREEQTCLTTPPS